jgi:hypothetical protein
MILDTKYKPMNVGYKTEEQLQKEEKLTVLEDRSSDSNKYVIWHIEGGLGKNIAATAIIKDVKERYADRKLIMVVSYPEIFLNNPNIHRVYRVGMTSYFYDDYIKDKDTIVFRHEPYFQSDHILKKKHLIHNWCDLMDVEYKDQLPQLHPNAVQKMLQYNWQREKPVMVIQTNGGGMNNEFSYAWSRDIPYEIAVAIADRYRNTYHIIQVTRPNTNLIPNVEYVTQQLSNFEMLSIIASSQKRILIDSFLQHAAAGMGLPSTVLWIGTSPVNFGYKMHKNIVAKDPPGTTKLIDSYIFDYSLEGSVHECPYNSVEEMFDINTIFKNI